MVDEYTEAQSYPYVKYDQQSNIVYDHVFLQQPKHQDDGA